MKPIIFIVVLVAVALSSIPLSTSAGDMSPKKAQQVLDQARGSSSAPQPMETGRAIEQLDCADQEIQRRAAEILRQLFAQEIIAAVHERAPTPDELDAFSTDIRFSALNSSRKNSSGDVLTCGATAEFKLRNRSSAADMLSRVMPRVQVNQYMGQIEAAEVVNYRASLQPGNSDVVVEAKIREGFEPAGLEVATSQEREELASRFAALKIKHIQMFGPEPQPPRFCVEAAEAWGKWLFKDPTNAIGGSILTEMIEQLAVTVTNFDVDWICFDDLESSYAGAWAFGAMSAISKQHGVVGVTVFGEWEALDYAFSEMNRTAGTTAAPEVQRPLSLQAIKQRYEAGEYDEPNPDETFKALDGMTGLINERLGFIQRACGNACAHTVQSSTVTNGTSSGIQVKARIVLSKPQFHSWYMTASDRELITVVQNMQTQGYGTLTLCAASIAGTVGCSADGLEERASVEAKRKELKNADSHGKRASDL